MFTGDAPFENLDSCASREHHVYLEQHFEFLKDAKRFVAKAGFATHANEGPSELVVHFPDAVPGQETHSVDQRSAMSVGRQITSCWSDSIAGRNLHPLEIAGFHGSQYIHHTLLINKQNPNTRGSWTAISRQVKQAIAAFNEARYAPANDRARLGEVRQYRFAPRRLGTIHGRSGLTSVHIIAEIDQRLPQSVVRTVDIVVIAADFHDSGRWQIFIDINGRQAAIVFQHSTDSSFSDRHGLRGSRSRSAQLGADCRDTLAICSSQHGAVFAARIGNVCQRGNKGSKHIHLPGCELVILDQCGERTGKVQ